MTLPAVAIAGGAQQHAVAGVVTLAFVTDPVARFTWPDPGDYLAHMPKLVAAFGGKRSTTPVPSISTVFSLRLYGCRPVSIQITRRCPR